MCQEPLAKIGLTLRAGYPNVQIPVRCQDSFQEHALGDRTDQGMCNTMAGRMCALCKNTDGLVRYMDCQWAMHVANTNCHGQVA